MNYRIFILPLILSGCSTFQPVKDNAVQHLLEPLVPERTLSGTTPAMAISRPALPVYLDRPQLVTRRDGVLVMSQTDIWAEPLDAGIARVMASNLCRLTGSMNIQAVERFSSLDYSDLLELRLSQFEPAADGVLVLQGTWKLQSVKGGEAGSHFFRIAVPVASSTDAMKDRVAAMNRALERLAREVAAAILR